jgi:putative Mg2+ transporter-C (MgtC) family protein
VRFARNEVMPEPQFKAFLAEHGFTLANMSQRLTDDGLFYEYRMVIRTHNTQNLSKIAVTLRQMPSVRAFGISPTGD